MEKKKLINSKSIDSIISGIGYGRYQALVFLSSGFTSFSQGSELVLISIFQRYLTESDSFEKIYATLLCTLIFAGQALGIIISGIYSDKCGRLFMLKIGYAVVVCTGLVSSLFKNYLIFSICRFFTNIGIGICLPVGTAYTLENCPKENRGVLALTFEICYLIGQLIVLALVFFFMNGLDGEHWALVFGTNSAFGLLILFIMYNYLCESPWFLIRNNQNASGIAALNYMKNVNCKKNLTNEEIEIIKNTENTIESNSKYKIIFDLNHYSRTFKLMWAMSTNLLGFSGAFYLLPILLDSDNFYIGYLMCIVFILPFWVFAMCLIENKRFGRRMILVMNFFIISILAGIGCWIFEDQLIVAVILGLICGIASVSNVVLVPFILEQYETEIRSSSYTVINIFARIQMIYVPILFAMISFQPLYPILIYMIIYTIAMICIFTIKEDTAGKELDIKYN